MEEKNTQAEAVNTDPVENGEQAGRTFTQDEVNAIIRDRLARERAKAEVPADGREQALAAREAKLDCREYISEKGYPAALLDIFDTSNAEGFRHSIEKLVKAFPAIIGKSPAYTGMGSLGNFPQRHESREKDPVADAFKPHI